MLDMTSVLSKLMLCLAAVEYLATADHWFSSVMSLMYSEILVKM
jgi:hypothetical protein